VYGDAVAVLREALSNVGRHAEAHLVQVVATVDAHCLSIEVIDDVRGLRKDAMLCSLANLRAHAIARGGSFVAESRRGSSGTHVRWTVRLPAT